MIFLATGAFVYLMCAMPSTPTVMYFVGCAAAVIMMITAIIVVSIRVRRLQEGYFAGAGNAAEEYAAELVRKMKSGKR